MTLKKIRTGRKPYFSFEKKKSRPGSNLGSARRNAKGGILVFNIT